jgi:hypothetical protein
MKLVKDTKLNTVLLLGKIIRTKKWGRHSEKFYELEVWGRIAT